LQYFGSIYAQLNKSRRKVLFLKKGPASAVYCRRTESAESLDENKTQKSIVFYDACFKLNRDVYLHCQIACVGFM